MENDTTEHIVTCFAVEVTDPKAWDAEHPTGSLRLVCKGCQLDVWTPTNDLPEGFTPLCMVCAALEMMVQQGRVESVAGANSIRDVLTQQVAHPSMGGVDAAKRAEDWLRTQAVAQLDHFASIGD